MTRYEFIGRLREALTAEELPASVIEENVRFYNRYIDDELQKGLNEEEIFAELGDPRLIAKTIVDTWQSDDTSFEREDYSYSRTYDNYGQSSRYSSYGESSESKGSSKGSYFNVNGHSIQTDKWYWKLIPIALIAVVLLIVFFFMWVGFGVLRMILSIVLSPAFWVIIIGLFLFNYLIRRR